MVWCFVSRTECMLRSAARPQFKKTHQTSVSRFVVFVYVSTASHVPTQATTATKSNHELTTATKSIFVPSAWAQSNGPSARVSRSGRALFENMSSFWKYECCKTTAPRNPPQIRGWMLEFAILVCFGLCSVVLVCSRSLYWGVEEDFHELMPGCNDCEYRPL